MLTAALALVKPIGMRDADAHAWLATACREVAHLPADVLEEATSAARRTCTRHGQVVPAIIREAASIEQRRRREAGAQRFSQEASNLLPFEPPHAGMQSGRQSMPWRPTPEELAAARAEVELWGRA